MNRLRIRMISLATIVGVAGGVLSLGQLASGSSDGAPVPHFNRVEAEGLAGPALDEPLVPLWEPLQSPLSVEFGGFLFVLPVGATAIRIYDGPVVDNVAPGEGVAPQEHALHWIVSRGQSWADIDAVTGMVFGSDVQPEDAADFQNVLYPTQSQP